MSASKAVKKTAEKKKRPVQREDSRSGRTHFLSPRFFLILAVVVAVGVILFSWYWQPLKIWYRETRRERVLRETLAAVKSYNDDLRAEISSLETTEGVKDYARRELNLVEDGEHGITVLRDGEQVKEPRDTRESLVSEIPNSYRPFGSWTAFLDSLFGAEK